MMQLFRRLRYLFNRRRFDRELADDMEFHREMAGRKRSAFRQYAAASRRGPRSLGLDVV